MSDSPAPRGPSVIGLLDHLEHLIAAGRRVPFTSGTLINDEEMREILDRARLSLPEDLVRAHQTVAEREQILAEAARSADATVGAARAEADVLLNRARSEAEELMGRVEEEARRLVEAAQQRSGELVSEHAIVQSAQQHASQTLAQAEALAEKIRGEADEYARDVMERLEEQLLRTVGTVRKGIDSLPSAASRRRIRAKE